MENFDPRWIIFFVVVVAIFAGNKMSRKARHRSLEAAKLASNTVGHSKLGSGVTLIDKSGGLRLAYDKVSGKLLRLVRRDGQHGLVIGATGCGKSARWMISAILDLAGRASIIYVDCKGNTTAVVGKYLAEKCRLIVCNPYENQKGLFPMELPPNTPFNPLAGLSPDQYGFTAACRRIARTFVDHNLASNENSAHFRDRAVTLIAGIIMHVCDRYPPHLRHLTTVRNVLTSSNGEDLWLFLIDAKENGTPYCQQKLARWAAVDEEGSLIARYSKEAADVIATAERYTEWFGNEDLGPSLEGDGFQYAPLKDECSAVALICPLQYLHDDGGKWLKLHVTSAIHDLWRNGRGKKEVYFILDESDQYADPIIHAALNTARNFGINLIIMVQQMSDIDNRYGKQTGAFLNGTSWKLIFSSDDERTRKMVELLSGTQAVMAPSIAVDNGHNGGPKLTFTERGIPLKAAYEVGEIPPDECILHVKGVGMLEVKTRNYWEDKTLDGKWSADPYEQ